MIGRIIQIFILMVRTAASGLQHSTPSMFKKKYRSVHILTVRLIINLNMATHQYPLKNNFNWNDNSTLGSKNAF